MNRIIVIAFLIACLTFTAFLQAKQAYQGDGSWAVIDYTGGSHLVISLGVYRDDPSKGALPTFMLNKDSDGCYASFGLSMLKKDLPQTLSNDQSDALRMLKTLVVSSDLYADDELLIGAKGEVQALDYGPSLYARKVIDTDTLAAFMLAKTGMMKVKNKDLVIRFSMNGFEKTMNTLMDEYCD